MCLPHNLPHRTIEIWDLKAALDPRTPTAELCLRTLAVSYTLSTCVCVYTIHEPSCPVYCPVCGAVIPPYTLSSVWCSDSSLYTVQCVVQ